MLSHKELIQTPEYWVEQIQNRLFEQVESYMEKQELTQTELAEQLGVSKGYISQILNGNFNHTLKKLVNISLAVGVVPDIQFKNAKAYSTQVCNKKTSKEMNYTGITPEIIKDEKFVSVQKHTAKVIQFQAFKPFKSTAIQ